LVLSRYGSTPLDFGPVIVELTAVHFHYAGFVAPVLALRLARRLRDQHSARCAIATACVAVILAATPITAAGITLAEWLGAVGALLFFVALTIMSVLTLTAVVPEVQGRARWLLAASSVAVLAPLALAVLYAAGRWLSTPAPSIRTMAWTHGLLNALGFSLCGVLGWLSVREEDASSSQASARVRQPGLTALG
jgi:hypothetical protein